MNMRERVMKDRLAREIALLAVKVERMQAEQRIARAKEEFGPMRQGQTLWSSVGSYRGRV